MGEGRKIGKGIKACKAESIRFCFCNLNMFFFSRVLLKNAPFVYLFHVNVLSCMHSHCGCQLA